MRFSLHKVGILVIYCTSILLMWSTILTLFHENASVDLKNDYAGVKLKRSNTKSNDKKSLYFQPLTDTNNSWTMFDIRKGSKSQSQPMIGVAHNGNFDMNLTMTDRVLASSQNRTVQSNILIYNRVPKCASTTMQNILHYLANKNHFRIGTSKIYWR